MNGNTSMRHLVNRLKRTEELEGENSDLQQRLAKVASELKTVKTRSESARNALERAAKINPDDPPAALHRGLDLVDAVGLRMDISKLLDLLSQVEELGKQVGAVQQERDKIREGRDNLMRRGRGVEYPSCWTTPAGETEYIFDVTIRDSGVVVRDIAPVSRKDDQAQKLVDDFPRDTEIAETKFRSGTARLNAWSRANECRFFVNLRDETGEHNKERYKTLIRLIEEHFYKRELRVTRAHQVQAKDGPAPNTSMAQPPPAESAPRHNGFPWLNPFGVGRTNEIKQSSR